MQLLDAVAQSQVSLTVTSGDGQNRKVTGPADFAARVRQCPLRYIVTDNLVRLCVDLALAEGDRLSSCLDLASMPAESLWIEWDDAVRSDALRAFAVPAATDGTTPAGRAGILIESSASGRRAVWRSFWNDPRADGHARISALETVLDLDTAPSNSADCLTLLEGSTVALRRQSDASIDQLLTHVGFRMDPSWREHYASANGLASREQIVLRSLAAVGYDALLLLALMVLLATRVSLPTRPIERGRLNLKRARTGKHPLLDHIEIDAPVFSSPAVQARTGVDSGRQSPRFHHVRGHLVRRADAIYWRGPHWRGHLRLGRIAARTVTLHAPAKSPALGRLA
jgi:hypothetical protein